MQDHEKVDVTAMTADLLSYCPDVKKRDKMWEDFIERKKKGAQELNAAILTKGDFWAYICEVLEFTERSAGGF